MSQIAVSKLKVLSVIGLLCIISFAQLTVSSSPLNAQRSPSSLVKKQFDTPIINNTTIPSKDVFYSKQIAPVKLKLVPEKQPPQASPAKIERFEVSKNEAETPPPITNENIKGPNRGTSTNPGMEFKNSTLTNANAFINPSLALVSEPIIQQIAAGDVHVYTNSYVGSHGSVIAEPSAANKGRLIFYTANWFTARSLDGGKAWTFNDPFADMGKYIIGGEEYPQFCGDQDVIYDPIHQIFIWYRQACEDSNKENYFRLSISRDTINWWRYDYRPTYFNSAWKNQQFDYPQLALTNNYLYITTNMVGVDGSSKAILSQWSLANLAKATPISPKFGYQDAGRALRTVTPAQGASDIMFFGTHLTNERMRIYKWVEASDRLEYFDQNIDPWLPTGQSMLCKSPDGYNWCARADNRISSGWVRGETVGFIWNVAQGRGFIYPYINAATFSIRDMSYTGRPYVWHSDYAWMYGFTSSNKRGLALVAFVGGGALHPIVNFAIADNYVQSPPGWVMYWIASSTNAPARQAWGDFIRVRPYGGESPLWIGTGYILHGGSGKKIPEVSDFIYPRYFVFGREVDGAPLP
jgi:hypothetical protein